MQCLIAKLLGFGTAEAEKTIRAMLTSLFLSCVSGVIAVDPLSISEPGSASVHVTDGGVAAAAPKRLVLMLGYTCSLTRGFR